MSACLILQAYMDQINRRKQTMAEEITLYPEDGEEEDDILELEAEDGVMMRMRLMTVLEHEGRKFAALVQAEAFDDDEEEEVDVSFMEVVGEDDDEEQALCDVEDEEILNAVFDKFLAWAEVGEDDDEE